MHLADRVRLARREAGLSQEALARRAEISTMTISRTERGVTRPGVDVLARIARALGVSVAELIEAEERAA